MRHKAIVCCVLWLQFSYFWVSFSSWCVSKTVLLRKLVHNVTSIIWQFFIRLKLLVSTWCLEQKHSSVYSHLNLIFILNFLLIFLIAMVKFDVHVTKITSKHTALKSCIGRQYTFLFSFVIVITPLWLCGNLCSGTP